MDRKEFLTLIGASTGAVIIGSCLGSCKKKDSTSNISVDFTLDLTLPANASLLTNGGYVYSQGVIVAKTTAGNYIAVAQSCTHEGATIAYQTATDNFVCPRHGASFSDSGTVTNGPASTNLQKFNTSLTGTSLRVYS